MSDTPETDDLARGNHVVPTEWAKQLERERDEAREKIERQADIGCSFQKTNPAMCGRYKQERDESQEKYATEATEHMLAVNKVCNERDEAITTIEDAKRALKATDYEGILLAAMRVKEERDEARENLDEEMKFHHRTHSELIETQCKLLDMEMKCDQLQDEIKRLKVILDLIKKDVSW